MTVRINLQGFLVNWTVQKALGVLSGGSVPKGVLLLVLERERMAGVLLDELELLHQLSLDLAFAALGDFVKMNGAHNLFR